MSISVDHVKATEILFSESAAAANETLPEIAAVWQDRVKQLGSLCPHRKSSTTIAALGTAILAKATDQRVDVYSLLDRGEADRSYSARSLADNVLARHRARLEIDLGARGTNPLNNTPFIGKTRIDEISGVRNREGWAYFMDLMEQLRDLPGSAEARLALRGFIAARRRALIATIDVAPQLGDNLSVGTLTNAISEYAIAESEGGRRAQACAAGLLDAVFGPERVVVGAINDPDRRAPLDIAVRSLRNDFEVAFEVKDKPISDNHVLSSAEKTFLDHGTTNLVFLGVSSRQVYQDFSEAELWGSARGIKVTIFVNWLSFVMACKCFAPVKREVFEGIVSRSIVARGGELGVRRQSLEEFVLKIESGSSVDVSGKIAPHRDSPGKL
ncbi:restriction endonuclease, SacI family [Rubinisphaera margarita]|uniref:restriction endonuclease, SacI family n=1 Tax=Rubinisphaera margarita TaxID=2909586 RepID=UPI001EE85476|nr:restriction endonuclease, SacI family [Rubinisphaera margarita]MCG6158321.1 restriction endonuclease, SacI family [Rubinisphaera margarita]